MPNFYLDTICSDSRFHSTVAIRDPALLEPTFRTAILSLIVEAENAGVMLRMLETFRSEELQQIYFARGVTQLQNVGVHHYGLACDLGIMIGGQVNWKADYSVLGKLGRKRSLVWGGDWGHPERPHSFRDYDHLQRVAVEDQSRLFNGSWYPELEYRALPPSSGDGAN